MTYFGKQNSMEVTVSQDQILASWGLWISTPSLGILLKSQKLSLASLLNKETCDLIALSYQPKASHQTLAS